MKMKKAAFALLLALLGLMACSSIDGTDDVLARYDKDGYRYSPTYMRGTVHYLKDMKPEYVKVMRLDEKLYPVDSIEAPVEKNYDGEYTFKVDDRDYEFPFVKIVPVFPLDKNEKMEFAQYVRLRESNIEIRLNLPEAVMSGRIETLVREKGLEFDSAMTQAIKEMQFAYNLVSNVGTNYSTVWNDVFDKRLDVYEYMRSEANLNGLLMYIYCRHEVSDSVFYSTFKEYREGFAKNGVADSALMAKSADAWLSTFVVYDDDNGKTQYRSFSRDSVVNVGAFDENFFKHTYGVSFKLTRTRSYENEFFELDNKYSSLKGRTFVYDEGLNYWRLQTLLDDSIGVCLYSKDSIAVSNGIYYRCRYGSAVWNVESNRDTILNKMYGYCKGHSISSGESGYLSDSLFVCECDSSNICDWTDKYIDSTFKKGDKLYASALNAKAVKLFGRCSKELNGEVRQIDSVSVSCSFYYDAYRSLWKLVESDEE
ncbi:hypothetical protein [Fibrobacter sp. UWB11]|uniref:hypothetical protein n=1 Tax=Fibrobacter sp. UWB11 TaxID=1896202 RepID=UPI0020C9D600|nr:hypothetical protein [Fibrobacter sp. UWB11]